MKKVKTLLRSLLLTLTFTFGIFLSSSTQAGILSVTGPASVISPPPSVVTGAFSNNFVYVFQEQSGLPQTNFVFVDIANPGNYTNQSVVITRGSSNIFVTGTVDTYYTHHAVSSGTNVLTASIRFDTNILGIICISTNMTVSDQQFGVAGTVYPGITNTVRGYEFNLPSDRVLLSPDRRTVTITTSASAGNQDDLRIITAANAPIRAPVANAGTNQTVTEFDLVTLNASGSYDQNSPPWPITYAWTQLSGIPVTLSNAYNPIATFIAPAVPSGGAVLVFQVAVSNGTNTSTSSVTINVNAINAPPTANAGADQAAAENTYVLLDGSASSDPDNDTLTYQWTQISGPTVQLLGSNSVPVRFFQAPDVTHAQGSNQLQFQLVVNDGHVNSGPSVVTVTVTNVNDAPIADVSPGQTVDELAEVTLDGSASSDPDGNPLTYSWTQVYGVPVTLQNSNSAQATFIAPQVTNPDTNSATVLAFQLTVSDGIASSSAWTTIFVSKVNHAPLADAGIDQTVPEGATVTLDGTGSTDPDGDALSFYWLQVDGTNVTLVNTDTLTPSFTAPLVGPSGTSLTFQLTVDDGRGGVTNDIVVINVTDVNHPPTVDAGTNQTTSEGDVVTLSGSASDIDGNDLTIEWTQISGPTVNLVNATTLTPSFTAPSVTRDETNVIFRLTADDRFGGVSSDDVSIHVANINHAPVSQPPANMTVSEGSDVSLIGQGTDPDTEEQSQLVYAWTQIAGPEVTLSGTGPNASFTAPLISDGGDPDTKVTLTFTLTVTDPNGASSSNSVDVVVANVDHSPTAVAGNNLIVDENSSVTLNGSASSDPDSDPLTFSWVQVAGPTVTLLDANTALPHFTAPFVSAAGATLQFQLTVDDGFDGTNSTTVTVTVNNINDPPNADHAQASIATLWPPNHAMTKVSIVGIIDPNNNATIKITSVTQDEPVNGTGDGDAPVDAVINSDGTVVLRAERAANGNGRVYHIHFTASDFEGSTSGVVNVIVPLNKKTDGAVDGGELYDSTQ